MGEFTIQGGLKNTDKFLIKILIWKFTHLPVIN